jgi:hypothetical protein
MAKKADKPGAPADAEAKPASKKPAQKRRRPASKKRTKKPSHLRAAEIRKDIELVRKRTRILELKETGAGIRQISELLTRERMEQLLEEHPAMPRDVAEYEAAKGNSRSRVHQLLAEALEDLWSTQRLTAKHMVELELAKLERNEVAVQPNLLRMAELDRNLLKQIERSARDGDGGLLLSRLLEHGFHADEVEKYSRVLERIWKRRDSLLGLNKPVKVEHSGEDGKPIETITRVILPQGADAPIEPRPETGGGEEE